MVFLKTGAFFFFFFKLQMGMVGPRVGQPNVNQLPAPYMSQGQFPGSGPGVGAQSGMTPPGGPGGMVQVRGLALLFDVA